MSLAGRVLESLSRITESDVVRDLANLSSGTLATIFGVKDYEVLKAVQKELLDFCRKSSSKYSNWVQVVQDYAKSIGLELDKWGKAKVKGVVKVKNGKVVVEK